MHSELSRSAQTRKQELENSTILRYVIMTIFLEVFGLVSHYGSMTIYTQLFPLLEDSTLLIYMQVSSAISRNGGNERPREQQARSSHALHKEQNNYRDANPATMYANYEALLL
jgi:hypothetical protein